MMETIKVNMNPNPLDVQTIHASQNDGEARQWEFKLHNNGDVIDSSEVTDQMVFKAYKGGTEQLLPENTSTPTTSPFKGDIRYHQGLLTDQEFTYRQSPTEEDGLAKITDIKGNTLVWNQLVQQNGATETLNGVTFTNNNDGSWTVNGTASGGNPIKVVSSSFSLINGHKYLVVGGVNGGANNTYRMDMRPVSGGVTKEFYNEKEIWTSNVTANDIQIAIRVQNGVTVNNLKYKPQVFDLTMLGIDNLTNNEVLEWFATFFPLSYYAFNQGSLLSFNGNGLKTVGKNQIPKAVKGTYTGNGITCVVDEDGTITFNGTATASGNAVIIPLEEPYKIQENAYLHLNNNVANSNVAPSFENATNPGGGISRPLSPVNAMVVIGQKANYEITRIRLYITNGTSTNVTIKPMVTFSQTESEYEPYTSSTLSLPISTYFPSGMKSAGNVYDELTESKAITRIGSVDLGSLTWTKTQGSTASNTRFYTNAIQNVIKRVTSNNNVANILTNRYRSIAENIGYLDQADGISSDTNGTLSVYDSAYSTAEDFKQAIQGQYLYYELKESTETSFTTASLVTENTEIPLSNEDGVLIGKCTEELSAEPGFHDAKIKLSDSDGKCYSNKIQLHIERSPK